MKLGIFESGLGGVMIAKAIRDAIPDIDLCYLGDTLHIPYGNRSEDAIFEYTKACVEHLFDVQDCALVILACNTASASALRKLQQTWLPDAYPDRRILGVVVPTIEYAIDRGHQKIGLIGTNYTVKSNVYEEELRKINPDIRIFQINTPLLVPLIEYDGMQWVDDVLGRYIAPLIDEGIEALVLSCTHYVCLKDRIRERYGVEVYAQDEIIPEKLADYLRRHPEIDALIGKGGETGFFVSDITDHYRATASEYYDQQIDLKHVQVKR